MQLDREATHGVVLTKPVLERALATCGGLEPLGRCVRNRGITLGCPWGWIELTHVCSGLLPGV